MNSLNIGILNGGRSLRMGFPKSMIDVGGLTAIEMIYQKSKLFTDRIVILGCAEKPDSLSHVPSVPDRCYRGPLAALDSASQISPEDWLLWAVDMPMIPAEMIGSLLDYRTSYPEAVIASDPVTGKFETCFAWYSGSFIRNLLENARARQGHFSIQHYLQESAFQPAFELYTRFSSCFKDWNTPEELKNAI